MIFIPLDNNPVQSAKDLTNFHVKKYVKVVTQLLYLHVATHNDTFGNISNSITFFKLPKVEIKNEIWLKESVNNLAWLIEYGFAVHQEHENRFGQNHPYMKDFSQLSSIVLGTYMREGIEYNHANHTPFMVCIPEMYIVYEDPIDTFRYYYVQSKMNQHKSGWGKLKSSAPPEWFNQPKYKQEIDCFEGGTKLAKMVAKYKDTAIKGKEKEMIYDFIKREADKMRIPVEQLIFSKYEKRTSRYFKYSNVLDQQLFTKLVHNIFGGIPIYHVKKKRRIKEYTIKLTDVEFIELNNQYNFHRSKIDIELKKIMDNLSIAYCVKNDIGPKFDTDADYQDDADDHVSKDLFNADMAASLIMGMNKNQYVKGIE